VTITLSTTTATATTTATTTTIRTEALLLGRTERRPNREEDDQQYQYRNKYQLVVELHSF